MTFFNKKEDVLQIELTPYGRKILGQGKFKPVYYTFLDDDVLYDAEKAGISENPIHASNRILKETPYVKPQTNYKGVESSIDIKSSLSMNLNDDKVIPERSEKLQYQLGTNNYNTNKSAEISVTFLLGEISGNVSTQYSRSNIAPIDIPQINCDLEYILSVGDQSNPKTNKFGKLPEDFFAANFKNDGTYVNIDRGEILILLSEEGGFPEKENFSIEVFEITEDNDMKPLKFDKQKSNIVNGILQDDSDIDLTVFDPQELSEDRIDYHMELKVDDEVPSDKICLGTDALKKDNIYVDIEVDCEDIQTGFEVDLYSSIVTKDDLEDC
jgi:hypothetical protein